MSLRCRRGSWTSSATCSTRRALAAVLVPLALACAGEVPWRRGPSASEEAYRAAAAPIASDPERAERELEAFLRDWPRSARADDASLDLARLRFERGDEEGAAQILRRAIRQHSRGDRVDRARLLLAKIEAGRGRRDEAYRAASAIRAKRLNPARRIEAYRLLATLAEERGETATRLGWLGRIAHEAESGAAREAAEREIDAVLAELGEAELAAAARSLGSRPPAARVELRRAEAAIRAGDLEAAEGSLAAVEELSPTPEEETRRQELWARVRARRGLGPAVDALPGFSDVARLEAPRTAGARGTLGVVLPLSGSFARFGEASLRGVLLASGIFGEGPEEGVRLLVRDSRADPGTAAAAVAALAADPEVSAIVGPLLADESEAAAAVAQRARVPLLALTPRERVARERSHVFRLGLTPRTETAALADYAVGALGVERIAILHPRDAYGRGLKDLFWDAIEQRGGSVVGVGSYAPEATDFARPIRRLIGYLLLGEGERAVLRERKKLLSRAKRATPEAAAALREEAAELTAPDGGPLPPIVDFEALFIADTHDKVALIAPQLAFHEVEEAKLLGASGWNHPDLLRIGGPHVEGAVFTESFFAESRFGFVREFRERYLETFAEEPDARAAQGFDAATLVLIQLARGLTTRTELREGLLAVRAHPGVSGVTTIGADGNALKRPFLLGVRGGHVVSLD